MTSRVFDLLSDRYDQWFERNRVIAENELKLLKSLNLKGLGLDIGIGTGRFASRLGVPIGIDPAKSMLIKAHRRGIEVVRAIGESLPFRDEAFDSVLLIATLCFVDNPDAVLMEAARVIKKNGLVVACIVPRDSSWGQHYMALGAQRHPFYSIAKLYTTHEVEEKMLKSGLKIVNRIATLSFNPLGEAKPEEPSDNIEGKGFVCIISTKLS